MILTIICLLVAVFISPGFAGEYSCTITGATELLVSFNLYNAGTTILKIAAISQEEPLDPDSDDPDCFTLADFWNLVINTADPECAVTKTGSTFNFVFVTFGAVKDGRYLFTTTDAIYKFSCSGGEMDETISQKTLIKPTLNQVTLNNSWEANLDFVNNTDDVITEAFLGEKVRLCGKYRTLSNIPGLDYDGMLLHTCEVSPAANYRPSFPIIDGDGCPADAALWRRGFEFVTFEFVDPLYEFTACTAAFPLTRIPSEDFLHVRCQISLCKSVDDERCRGDQCIQGSRKKRSIKTAVIRETVLRMKREVLENKGDVTLEVAKEKKPMSRSRSCMSTVMGKTIIGILSTLVALMFPLCVVVFYKYMHLGDADDADTRKQVTEKTYCSNTSSGLSMAPRKKQPDTVSKLNIYNTSVSI